MKILSALVLAALLPALLRSQTIAGRRPDIIFILTDDQGFGDVSANGNPVLKTPNMDRLHDEGVRFTDFHVSPTCAPTRSALHTGRHEFKNGITHTINERERLTLDAVTLPQILKSAGYTTGIFGKWHLGDEDDHQPEKRGYDEVFIHGAGGIGQHYPGSCGDAPGNTYFSPMIKHNGRFEKTDGYCTDVFFAQAEKWIGSVKGKQPFYCYIATNAPHGPLQVRPDDEARYQGKVATGNEAKYLGMVANIDDNIGRLLAKLKEWGIEKDTLVIFMNDNGGTGGVRIFNAGMRGQKGSPFLGGTRASSFWRWPGTLMPADCGKLTAHIDFFRTIAEIAGAKLDAKADKQVEGRSLVPLLENPRAAWPSRTLFTHVGRWAKDAPPESGKYVNCSVRTPDYHLVSISKRNKPDWLLFDLRSDRGEQHDIAAQNPQVVGGMQKAYEEWWQSVLPMMINEKVPFAAENPFWTLYRRQFGSLPPAATETSGKKRVLILGDSISIGYTPIVQKMLESEMVVLRAMARNGRAENCGGTKAGVANIDRWLQIDGGKWDVIHFNWGLHDLKHEVDGKVSALATDPPQSTVEAYEKQLREIVAKLKATGAQLIFATTTPVPEGDLKPWRSDADVVRYNEAALRVMKGNGIAVDNLYAFVKPREAELQLPVNVHFKPEGSKALAEEVVKSIRAALR